MPKTYDRAVWLFDLLWNRGPISYTAISDAWDKSVYSNCGKVGLSKRTFQNHKKAVEDKFGVVIKCSGYKYFISNKEELSNDGVIAWMTDLFQINIAIAEAKELQGRIIMANTNNSSVYLKEVIAAMKKSVTLRVLYAKVSDKSGPSERELEPFFLKVFDERWYLVAKERGTDGMFKTFSMDKFEKCEVTNNHFDYDFKGEPREFFNNYFGICYGPNLEITRIVIKAKTELRAEFLRKRPLHSSQIEIVENGENTGKFVFNIYPTWDFKAKIFSLMEQVEVIEPLWFRQSMQDSVELLYKMYNEEARHVKNLEDSIYTE